MPDEFIRSAGLLIALAANFFVLVWGAATLATQLKGLAKAVTKFDDTMVTFNKGLHEAVTDLKLIEQRQEEFHRRMTLLEREVFNHPPARGS